jgi:hypothetical protein
MIRDTKVCTGPHLYDICGVQSRFHQFFLRVYCDPQQFSDIQGGFENLAPVGPELTQA